MRTLQYRLAAVFALQLLLASAAPAQTAAAGPALRQWQAQVDELASAEFDKDKVGSLTIGVLTPSGGLWTRMYGAADSDKGIAVTEHTLYRIGSITKQFTALMLLQLVENGTVQLSDPVEKYYPDVKRIEGRIAGAPPITLVQLATHTAGLAADPDDAERFAVGPVRDWEAKLRAALPHVKYLYPPGSRYSYSNVGYAVLGAALSRAAKQPYVAYVQEHIFRPLGMTETSFEVPSNGRERVATGYRIDKGAADATESEREHQGRGYRVPNGGAYTTVADLAKFVSFQLGAGPQSVMKTETLLENYKRLIAASANLKGGYGIGFETFRRDDLQGFGHSGAVLGYESAAYFERETRTAVIMLRSATGGTFRGARLCINILQTLVAAQKAASQPSH